VCAVWQSFVAREALANGRCDVIVVTLRRAFTADDNAMMATIINEVATLTSGSFAAGVIGQPDNAVSSAAVRAERMLLNGSKQYILMTPDIFSGLLVGLLFLVTALIGVCCLHGVQTPTKFCHEALPAGKEF
jgi:hypothetical protein